MDNTSINISVHLENSAIPCNPSSLPPFYYHLEFPVYPSDPGEKRTCIVHEFQFETPIPSNPLSSENQPPRVFKQQPDGVGWWKYYLSTLVHLYREPLDIVGKSWRVSEKQLTTMLASPPLRWWWTPRWTKYVVPQRVQDARLGRCRCRVDEGTTIDQSRSCHN